jgi:hypothetical protein
MGMSSAPKTFAPATPFGQTPQTPIATQTQPLALNSGTQTPAMSGYQMQLNQPIGSPMTAGTDTGGGPQDAIAALRASRANMGSGGGRMPFFG